MLAKFQRAQISNSPLGSVDKALRALQRLGEVGADGIPLARLAADLQINKTSLHRTLSALRHRGFVEQDVTGNYLLGPAILVLADSHLRDESLRGIFHDGLSKLCVKINETCHIGVLVGEQVIYIDKVEPQRAIRIWSEIGWRNPACATALGRAIISQKFSTFESFAARFPSPIPKRTQHTRVSLKGVWQEIVDTRKRGFAKENQESELGIACMAVAILRGANVAGAISITAPHERMDSKRVEFLARKLVAYIEPHLPPGLSLQKPDASAFKPVRTLRYLESQV